MPELLLQSLLFIGTLAGLVKASDWFVGAAERIGLSLGIPSFIIGVTVVAAGTSLPELVSSIVAVRQGVSEIVVGNVVGSNIANICFVLALIAIMSGKFAISFNIRRVDLPMLIGATVLFALTIMDQVFSTTDAVVMCLGMVVFLGYVIKDSGREADPDGLRVKASWKDYATVAGAAAGIYFFANYNIQSIVALSGLLGIGSEIIALTAVSLGTSLPELVVSIVAMRKGSHEIVVGNVIGSNIFNTFAVMGIPGLIGTLVIPPGIVAFSLPVMLGATLIFAYGTYDREVNRWEGFVLLLLYAYFILETVSSVL